MIRNVVIHILNEQPLLADLFERPSAADVGLLCTNVRTMDGRRPVFIDSSDGVFFFPYLHVRFVEIPRSALDLPGLPSGMADDALDGHSADDGDLDDGDLELDEDFLRRIREV